MITDVILSTYSRAILNRFQSAGATNAHHAMLPEQLGIVRSDTFQCMADFGAVRITRDGRCFVDEPLAMEFLHRRRVRWISIAVIVTVFALLASGHWGLL